MDLMSALASLGRLDFAGLVKEIRAGYADTRAALDVQTNLLRQQAETLARIATTLERIADNERKEHGGDRRDRRNGLDRAGHVVRDHFGDI